MANKKKPVNEAARKAASDGKITDKEVQKIQRTGNASGAAKSAIEAIARAAADNRAQISEAAQRQLGITQSKDLSRSSVTQRQIEANPRFSSDFYVSGFQGMQGSSVNGGSYNARVPVYTYQGKTPGTAAGGNNAAAGGAGGASGASGPAMDPMTNAWSSSVDAAMAKMNKQIKAQIKAQTEQSELYMGMMKDMMEQMKNAGQSVQQPAYTVTTTQTPATGAQTTAEIAARKPVTNDTLTIDPVATATGTGLNLAI